MDWLKTLGNLAPAIGAAFSPLGAAGGLAIKALLNQEDASDADFAAYLQTPEGALKAKQADYDYKIALEKEQTTRLNIDKEDRNSARGMQNAALGQDDLFSKRFIYYFSAFWSAASALYIGFITFGSIPEDNIRFADTILGFILGTAVSAMFNYFYGSSSSSRAKDNIIKNLTH